jgi:hypothetical protein
MRPDFCVFILSHARPDRVFTLDTLARAGYTGKTFIIVDDADKSLGDYVERYGDMVLTFSKESVDFDVGDNLDGRRGVVYARNACFDIARSLGFRYFMQLDDDYDSGFYIRFNSRLEYGNTPRLKRSADALFAALLDYFEAIPALSVALSQGGDHIGGDSAGKQRPRLKRKAMNSFICSVDRQFEFVGRVNEDVNTYAMLSREGGLFFTVMQAQVNQLATQSNAGGMTEIYLDGGTYAKSFYSVLYAPSCVKITYLSDPRSPHHRIHHVVDWGRAAPKILHEKHRKPSLEAHP